MIKARDIFEDDNTLNAAGAAEKSSPAADSSEELAGFFFTARDAEDYESGEAVAYGPGTVYEAVKNSGPVKWPLLEERKRLLAIKKRPGLGDPDRLAWINERKPYWWKPARVRNRNRFDPYR